MNTNLIWKCSSDKTTLIQQILDGLMTQHQKPEKHTSEENYEFTTYQM